ncbi:hypothetical protein BDP27DRAFT_1323911 [Rhodocollybia butyracea]|uniref:Uncharacterized protein n=1 Tax=Rhodocollybia butyracea TaxID=206335 RepID=A0A9P5PW39_9AGAR|nr:hypothetical protein BDP27DRAFT_1323911 [Rhodocollybia butyracea]
MVSTFIVNRSSSDAGSSFSSRDCPIALDQHKSKATRADEECGYGSYDEFCRSLRSRTEILMHEEDLREKPKKFSYVSNWRRKVDPSDLTILVPPSPFYQSFGSPSSPVASIDPSRLCVTSIPPSEYASSYSESPVESPLCEFEQDAIVEAPVDFHEIYDAELDRMLDEASEVESSSSVSPYPIPGMHVPHVASTPKSRKPTRFQNVSSTIRWLPMRIKYSILSQTTHRSRK